MRVITAKEECDAQVFRACCSFSEVCFFMKNVCSMESKHFVGSNRSSLLEELLPASPCWATHSPGPHAWLLLWSAWLTDVPASPLGLTADSPRHARNIHKSLLTFFQLFFFFLIHISEKLLTAEIWFWCWTKSNFIPSPSPSHCSFENETFLQDGKFGLESVLPQNYSEFWQSRVISRLPLELQIEYEIGRVILWGRSALKSRLNWELALQIRVTGRWQSSGLGTWSGCLSS